MEKLNGLDYMTRGIMELMSHPDYSPKAFRIVNRIAEMDSEQIEKLIPFILRGDN